MSMEMLRHSRSLLHFRGEINPFLAAAKLVYPHTSTDCDALSAHHLTPEARSVIAAEMATDAGQPGRWPTNPTELKGLASNIARRLKIQWPAVNFEQRSVHEAVTHAASLTPPGQKACPQSIQDFQLALAERLPGLNPWFYDLDPKAITAALPDIKPPTSAPGPNIIEEPPFVLHQPWDLAKPKQLGNLPLLIKTPSNAYRLPFLRALFPNARVQVLHLTRNPAAAINGLVDGWRFRGFHAHKLEQPHGIDGAPERNWWKYDLPPGWRAWTQRSLVEVAGFQWRSAHEHILDNRGDDALQIRFEDLIGPTRHRIFERIFSWMDAPLDPNMARIIQTGLPPVMATERPRQRRWFARAELLEPVLNDPRVAHLTNALGYTDRATWV